MTKLKIGIIEDSPGWKIILQQIGVDFSEISSQSKIDEYNLLIVNELPENERFLNDWLAQNKPILWEAKFFARWFGIPAKKKKIKFLQMDRSFADLGIIDFNNTFYYPSTKFVLSVNEQFLFRKANSLIISFSLNNVIIDHIYRRKRFFAERKELPSEIVARNSKGKIRSLIERILQIIHIENDLPFIQKKNYPNRKNLFIFRIDTDFSSEHNARELQKICQKNSIRASWFIDTNSVRMTTEIYSKMSDQEVGFHCQRHLVFPDYQRNYENIQQGLRKLHDAGIDASGFVAPFGDWNFQLAKVLEKFQFQYSSEFTLDYDDLPFFPYLEDHFSEVLQIPIHPVSMGRLRRSHFSQKEKLQYYQRVILEKFASKEPVILYHHPNQQQFELWSEIFRFTKKLGLQNITMQEFNDWWRKRQDKDIQCSLENEELHFIRPEPDNFLQITTKKGWATIPKIDVSLTQINFHERQRKKAKETASIRKWNWQDLLYNIESKRARKRQ